MIEAAGHASNFLDGVAPEQTNLQVKLKPPIKVSGSIVNAPEGNKIWLSYFQRITAGHHTDSQGASKEVAIVDGKGSFELPGLMCAPLARIFHRVIRTHRFSARFDAGGGHERPPCVS